MAAPADWEKRAASYLKGKLKHAGITYEALADRLNEKGFSETKAGIANKLARSAVAATFFLAALAEINCNIVRIEDI